MLGPQVIKPLAVKSLKGSTTCPQLPRKRYFKKLITSPNSFRKENRSLKKLTLLNGLGLHFGNWTCWQSLDPHLSFFSMANKHEIFITVEDPEAKRCFFLLNSGPRVSIKGGWNGGIRM
ncbi:hypothetical protein LguiB_018104 [Lonicera macranthoides]